MIFSPPSLLRQYSVKPRSFSTPYFPPKRQAALAPATALPKTVHLSTLSHHSLCAGRRAHENTRGSQSSLESPGAKRCIPVEERCNGIHEALGSDRSESTQ
ncbi:uncharacterized protein ZBAI_07588 [Zygosaccharomyces bailii ISA1307]|nr:uncharacterized protein ZBAI_07588 [Zygosaccharomyces bailii ISA1307]